MAKKGSIMRAEENPTLRVLCSGCRKSITVETQDDQTRGLVGFDELGKKKVFPTCRTCYESRWRPPGFVF